ncbi:hypothetical protein P3L10_023049 [Capsicum annuum]
MNRKVFFLLYNTIQFEATVTDHIGSATAFISNQATKKMSHLIVREIYGIYRANEGIAKQSQKEVEHSNDVSDVVGHTNPISTHIDSDKSVKMEVAEVNQKPLPVKEGPHSEMEKIKK